MPVYEFGCRQCGARLEQLRERGDDAPPSCPGCGGPTRRRFSRVGVRYESWGLNATDRLVGSTGGKDYRRLRETAERISDE